MKTLSSSRRLKQYHTPVLLSLLILLLSIVSFSNASEVIQTIILTRHGDRSAFRLLHNDPVNWKNLTGVDVGGELTGLGMRQCYHLGTHLRARYLNYSSPHYISGIPERYNKDDFWFKSSAENRCIQSSWSISMGLFPELGLIDDLTGEPALPHLVRPIDIHSKDAKNDIEIRSTDYCPAIARAFTSYRDYNPDYRKLEKKYKPFMEKMYRLTQDETARSLDQFYWFADTVMTQHYHNALHLPQLVKNIKLIEELGSLSLLLRRGNRNLVGTMSGGPFISFVLETMRQRIANENHKRFIHISGHDSTIIAILTALRLMEDYPTHFYKKPNYASALIFELRKQAATGPEEPVKYYVQILYKDSLSGKFEPFALKSLAKRGCEEHCPYDTFVELALEDATAGNWCSACGNHEADICIQEHYRNQKKQSLLLMIASIALGVLLAASILILIISVLIKAYANARNASYDEIR